jgi:hypothetical protein
MEVCGNVDCKCHKSAEKKRYIRTVEVVEYASGKITANGVEIAAPKSAEEPLQVTIQSRFAPTTDTSDWVDRFTEFFYTGIPTIEQFTDFIAEEIAKARAEGRGVKENITTLKVNAYDEGYREGQRELLDKVREHLLTQRKAGLIVDTHAHGGVKLADLLAFIAEELAKAREEGIQFGRALEETETEAPGSYKAGQKSVLDKVRESVKRIYAISSHDLHNRSFKEGSNAMYQGLLVLLDTLQREIKS